MLRRVEVPLEIRLDDLHLIMQVAVGWENYHLYEFRVGRAAWGIPDPDIRGFSPSGPRSARKGTLADLLAAPRSRTFKYLYDFGDGWEHSVKVEAVVEAVPDVAYPRLIAAEGACPPEDVGRPWGMRNISKRSLIRSTSAMRSCLSAGASSDESLPPT